VAHSRTRKLAFVPPAYKSLTGAGIPQLGPKTPIPSYRSLTGTGIPQLGK
jgi:hypothetical protein